MGFWWWAIAGARFINTPTSEGDVVVKVESVEIVAEVDGCDRGRRMHKIVTHEGNDRPIIFRLKQKGSRDPFDVSLSTTIQLEVEKKAGVAFPPIIALPTAPNADFVNGVVEIESLGSPISDKVGTYPYALTIIGPGTDVITADTGEIEVKERPGFPPPP